MVVTGSQRFPVTVCSYIAAQHAVLLNLCEGIIITESDVGIYVLAIAITCSYYTYYYNHYTNNLKIRPD